MLAELAARRRRPAIALLYSNASQDIPFRAFFDGLQPAWPELRLAYTVTRPLPGWGGPIGRIDARFIRANVADLQASRFFVCGSSAFVAAIAGTLHDLGIPDGRIKREGFPGYGPAAESARVALV
jgi:ferredoxin-NADP reductase